MGNTDWGEIIASTVGTISVVSGSSTLDVCLGETSHEFGSGRTETFETGSETMGDLGGVSSENPEGTAAIGGLATTASGIAATSAGPGWIVILFRKDSIPYSRVEKKAVNIFNLLHKNNKITLNKTSIKAKTAKLYEDFKKLFWTSAESIDYDRILVIEKILEKIADE